LKQPQRPYPTPSCGACPAPAKAVLHRAPPRSGAFRRAGDGATRAFLYVLSVQNVEVIPGTQERSAGGLLIGIKPRESGIHRCGCLRRDHRISSPIALHALGRGHSSSGSTKARRAGLGCLADLQVMLDGALLVLHKYTRVIDRISHQQQTHHLLTSGGTPIIIGSIHRPVRFRRTAPAVRQDLSSLLGVV
jgi:hypothetical protein